MAKGYWIVSVDVSNPIVISCTLLKIAMHSEVWGGKGGREIGLECYGYHGPQPTDG